MCMQIYAYIYYIYKIYYKYIMYIMYINPNDLLSIINSINPSIQFTIEYSKDAIPFLDILIERNNDKIWMDIYYKATETHRCLPFSSNNPKY